MMGSVEVITSAPGRLDFLNTHQDYKGLPVVAVAVNLRTYAALSKASSTCQVYSMDTGEYDEFTLDGLKASTRFGRYVNAALVALNSMGYRVGCFRLTVKSSIPIAAGLASSAALLVSVVYGITELYGIKLSKKDVAEAAFTAENQVLGIPCGRLDQYASAYGGVTVIRTRPPYGAEAITLPHGVFVAVDSGIRHSTAQIHPVRQRELNQALQLLLKQQIPENLKRKLAADYRKVAWEEIGIEEVKPYLETLPRTLASRIEYTIKAHRSTLTALRLIKGLKLSRDDKAVLEEAAEVIGLKKLRVEEPLLPDDRLRLVGVIMTYQHHLLSKLYDVSLPLLDRMVEAAVSSGAYGAKLSGAGLGGTVIALTGSRRVAERTLNAMIDAGGARGWIVRVDEGVKRH